MRRYLLERSLLMPWRNGRRDTEFCWYIQGIGFREPQRKELGGQGDMAGLFHFAKPHPRNNHNEIIHKSSSDNRFGLCYGFLVA